MTPSTILSGFRKCGIFPFNPDIFTEADYLSASPFRALEDVQVTESNVPPVDAVATAHPAAPTAVIPNKDPAAATSQDAPAAAPTAEDQTPGPSKSKFLGPYAIRGLPRNSAQSGPARPN